jgi:hypothetical protein
MTVKKYGDHPVISDIREARQYHDHVSNDDIYDAESKRLAFLTPQQRAAELRELANRINLYNENADLRAQSQAHRFETTLRNMHEKLKKAGR